METADHWKKHVKSFFGTIIYLKILLVLLGKDRNGFYQLFMDIANRLVRLLINTDIKVKGSIFNVIIISRRSRHHAGTRYIKRGINS